MYGWRGRLGIMVPSSNTTMENEFHRVKPDGISVQTSRLMLEQATTDALLEMESYIEQACDELKSAHVDFILYGCTTGSLIKGKGHDEKLQERIERHVGIKAITTSGAVLKALKALNCRDIAVLTPYIQELDEKEVQFLEANGYKVKNICGMGIADNVEIGKLEPSQVFNFYKKMSVSNADALFISCTNLRTLEIINVLEKDLKKPVITSNQASLVFSLRKMRVSLSETTKLGSLTQYI